MKKILVIFGIIWLLIESWILFFASPSPAFIPESFSYKGPIILGGPLILLVTLILATGKEKPAGAALLLGTAISAMALGLGSGSNLWLYFEGFLMFVVPQALLGTLLLKIGRDRERRENSARRKIRRI